MRATVPLAIIWLADRLVGSKRSLVRSSAPPLSGVRIAMDLPNGRHGAAPNGGVAGSPVFDTRGRFVGVVLRLKNESDAANAPFIILPASDIREVAKQAN